MTGLEVAVGPFWCPACSRAYQEIVVAAEAPAPCCPRCGLALEEQGTGDDDPDA